MRNCSGRIVQSMVLGIICGLMMYKPLYDAHVKSHEPVETVETIHEEVERVDPEKLHGVERRDTVEIPLIQVPVDVTPVATPDDIEEEMYWDSLELLACCVESEAGNQSKYGKALVCDVVLNRVDDRSGLFPNDIWDVIFQQNQFSVVLDGRIFQVSPTEETFDVVREELEHRTNTKVLFFTSEGYSQYGTPWKKVEDHYFSTW